MDPSELERRISILKKVNIFAEMEDKTLHDLAGKLKEVTLQSGEMVIYKGEKGHTMYIIIEGSVKVHDGEHIFAHLTGGQFFGEYSLIDTEVRSATVTGLEKTQLFRLEQTDFYKLLANDISFIKGILRVLIARLRDHDIVQEKLAKSNRRIKKQKGEIEKINEELVKLNEEKNHLIGIIAHDLRNPLTSAISISTEIKEELQRYSPDQTEYLEAMIKSLWRMNDMITRILDIKSIETKTLNFEFDRVNLAEILLEVNNQFKLDAAKKNITMIVNTIDAYADLDSDYTRQIFENLISNAIKFSPKHKSIHVNQKIKNNSLITEV
ncbi:MAG: cyclic nucleotide-binding domain-containing protein, partial [Bacteroidetes bacterium]|nr:cyclic nucleotide-binding domain-containing protein [Bacteroidota bacterium]